MFCIYIFRFIYFYKFIAVHCEEFASVGRSDRDRVRMVVQSRLNLPFPIYMRTRFTFHDKTH